MCSYLDLVWNTIQQGPARVRLSESGYIGKEDGVLKRAADVRQGRTAADIRNTIWIDQPFVKVPD